MDFEAHWNKPLPVQLVNKNTVPIWKRTLAFILDLIIFDLIVGAPLTGVLQESTISFGMEPTRSMLAVTFILVTLFFAYMVSLQYLIGQTIGMLAWNLTIGKQKLWQCVLRNIFIIPTFPFILLWIIDPIYLLFKGVRLTEKLSQTKLSNTGAS